MKRLDGGLILKQVQGILTKVKCAIRRDFAAFPLQVGVGTQTPKATIITMLKRSNPIIMIRIA